jgi:O-antigen ligase
VPAQPETLIRAPKQGMSTRRRQTVEIGGALLASLVIGILVAFGQPQLALALLVLGGAVFVFSRPRWALWGFLLCLPFFLYPVAVGQLSLFIGLPAALAVSLVLVSTNIRVRRGPVVLPTVSFAILATIAVASALLSTDPSHAGTRILYLITFGLLAGAIAYARSNGTIRERDVIIPLLISGAAVGLVVLIQFVIQFGIGKTTVYNHLVSLYPIFGGTSAEGAKVGENWVVPNFNLVRGVFPFMTAPGAGQYMMVSFVTALLVFNTGFANLDRKKVRWVVIITAMALAATLSRQSWVGAIAAMAFVFARNKPGRLLAGVILVVIIAFLVPLPGTGETLGQYLLVSTDSGSESSGTRLEIWSQAFHFVAHDNFFGQGAGLYQNLAGPTGAPYAHNVFLDALVELGLLGGAAFIAFVGRLLYLMWQRSRDLVFPVLLALVVANMFDDALYLPRNGYLIAALVGMVGGSPLVERVTARVREPRSDLPDPPLPERVPAVL